MAAVVDTSLSVLGQISPTTILLQTSGDTLTYTSGTNQILILFNADIASRTVTIDGDGGTTVVLPGAGATTASVSAGVTYTIAAGAYAVVRLDTIASYCAGTVSIVASVVDVVSAAIVH